MVSVLIIQLDLLFPFIILFVPDKFPKNKTLPTGSNRKRDLNVFSSLCHSSDSTHQTLVGSHMAQMLCEVKTPPDH